MLSDDRECFRGHRGLQWSNMQLGTDQFVKLPHRLNFGSFLVANFYTKELFCAKNYLNCI